MLDEVGCVVSHVTRQMLQGRTWCFGNDVRQQHWRWYAIRKASPGPQSPEIDSLNTRTVVLLVCCKTDDAHLGTATGYADPHGTLYISKRRRARVFSVEGKRESGSRASSGRDISFDNPTRKWVVSRGKGMEHTPNTRLARTPLLACCNSQRCGYVWVVARYVNLEPLTSVVSRMSWVVALPLAVQQRRNSRHNSRCTPSTARSLCWLCLTEP